MPFNCNTAQPLADPQVHYANCQSAIALSWQLFSSQPPFVLNPVLDITFGIYLEVLGNVGTGCTAGWNFIYAAGAAPNYNQEWLAELGAACAEQLQPASQYLVGRMSNAQDVEQLFSAVCEVIIAFADPLNEGYPLIPNPFG